MENQHPQASPSLSRRLSGRLLPPSPLPILAKPSTPRLMAPSPSFRPTSVPHRPLAPSPHPRPSPLATRPSASDTNHSRAAMTPRRRSEGLEDSQRNQHLSSDASPQPSPAYCVHRQRSAQPLRFHLPQSSSAQPSSNHDIPASIDTSDSCSSSNDREEDDSILDEPHTREQSPSRASMVTSQPGTSDVDSTAEDLSLLSSPYRERNPTVVAATPDVSRTSGEEGEETPLVNNKAESSETPSTSPTSGTTLRSMFTAQESQKNSWAADGWLMPPCATETGSPQSSLPSMLGGQSVEVSELESPSLRAFEEESDIQSESQATEILSLQATPASAAAFQHASSVPNESNYAARDVTNSYPQLHNTSITYSTSQSQEESTLEGNDSTWECSTSSIAQSPSMVASTDYPDQGQLFFRPFASTPSPKGGLVFHQEAHQTLPRQKWSSTTASGHLQDNGVDHETLEPIVSHDDSDVEMSNCENYNRPTNRAPSVDNHEQGSDAMDDAKSPRRSKQGLVMCLSAVLCLTMFTAVPLLILSMNSDTSATLADKHTPPPTPDSGTTQPVAPTFVPSNLSPTAAPTERPNLPSFLDEVTATWDETQWTFAVIDVGPVWQEDDEGPLHLTVLDDLDSRYSPALRTTIDEWQASQSLNISIVDGSESIFGDCIPILDQLRFCSGDYGETRWQVTSTLFLKERQILAGTVLVNNNSESSFLSNSTSSVQLIQYHLCHHLGHSLGTFHATTGCMANLDEEGIDEIDEQYLHPDPASLEELEKLYPEMESQ